MISKRTRTPARNGGGTEAGEGKRAEAGRTAPHLANVRIRLAEIGRHQ
jgi:hypothetical protein